MTVIISIIVSFFTALFTTVGFKYIRIKINKFLYGPSKRDKGKVKIQRSNISDKVYVVIPRKKIKRWVHPRDSLDKLGYYMRDDVEEIAPKELKKFKEKNDIDLTY